MTLLLLAAGSGLAQETDTGYRVGHVEIQNSEVFSDQEIESSTGALKVVRETMNSLHVKTRGYVLRQELLFSEGDVYRPELLAETERNLREMGFLNNISVTAVDTTADGRVNIRVKVRDSWSLKTNLAYSRSAAGEARWNISLSEVNFLGHGVTLGAGLGADENSSFSSLWFRKRRLTGAGLVLGVDYSQREDGHIRNVFLSRPFYSLADRWTLETQAFDALADRRFFLSNAGPAGSDPGRNHSLYARIPFHEKALLVRAMARLSPDTHGRLWRLGAGVEIRDTEYDVGRQSTWELSDGSTADLDFLSDPGQPLAREQGVTVFPLVWLQSLGRNWAKARFVLQYGPTEDIPMDWSLDLKAGPSGANMGSTTGFGGASFRAKALASKWWQLGPGFLMAQGEGEFQWGDSQNEYHRFNIHSGWLASYGSHSSPWLTRLVAEVGQGSRLTGDQALVLGLNRGVRTLDFDGMAGDRLMRWNVEQGKATPWEVLGFFKLGAAAFYSGGRAWWDDEDGGLEEARHEVGVGLRLGPTRSANSTTSKFDISWALDGSRGPVFTAVTRGFF